MTTVVNPAGDAGDTSPNILDGGTSTGISPPILLRTFGYSRPILVALRSLSLKPISFGYKTPPIRFSQAGGDKAHKARPPQPSTRVDATAFQPPILTTIVKIRLILNDCGRLVTADDTDVVQLEVETARVADGVAMLIAAP